MVSKYRKKPVVIEAMQLTEENPLEVAAWCGGLARSVTKPSDHEDVAHFVDIPTLEGIMTASVGDWVIKGVKGEFYPCKPDIFAATYDKVIDPLPREEPMMPWLVVTFIEKDKEYYSWNIEAQSVTDARTHVEEALVERGCPGTVIRVEPDR